VRWSVTDAVPVGIQVAGIPEFVPEAEAAILRSRLMRGAQEIMSASRLNELDLRIYTGGSIARSEHSDKQASKPEAQTLEKRASQYKAIAARFSWDFLVVPPAVKSELELSLAIVRLGPLLFEDWGLAEISSTSRVA
jgi:hypothetical protein